LGLSVGDNYQGGVILSIDCSGHHGIASDRADWDETNGYSDWRLPTPTELLTASRELHQTGKSTFQTGDLYKRYWTDWTMRRANDEGVFETVARAFDFSNGQWYEMNPAYKLEVRLVRDF